MAIVLLPAMAASQPYYSPVAAATSPGNLPTNWPFGQRTIQYQQLHDASSFSPALAGPIVLMRGRASMATAAGSADLELFLAPSRLPASSISGSFAQNELAAARVNVVARKVVNLPAVGAGAWGAPVIVFDVPYLAPPSQGLCWRVVIYSGSGPYYFVDTLDGSPGVPVSSYAGCPHPLSTQAPYDYSTARSPGLPWFLIGVSYVASRSLPAFLLVGTSTSLWGGTVPLPYDLTALGAPGCRLVVDPALLMAGTTVTPPFGRVAFQVLPIVDPTLVGKTLFTQIAFVDSAANALGLFTTGGLANQIPAPRGVGFLASVSPTASLGDLGSRGTDSGIVIALN